MGELTQGFLLLSDQALDGEHAKLARKIRTKGGAVTLKTMENFDEARGKTAQEKLGKLLNDYAHAVLIICSDNFKTFIDKEQKSKGPDKIKECIGVLKKFFQTEMKFLEKHKVNKIILLSINGNKSIPTVLKDMSESVIKGNIDDDTFINRIMSAMVARKDIKT